MAVADAQYLITFAVMLVVALVIGQLAARCAKRPCSRRSARRRCARSTTWPELLSGAIAAEQVADIVRDFLGSRGWRSRPSSTCRRRRCPGGNPGGARRRPAAKTTCARSMRKAGRCSSRRRRAATAPRWRCRLASPLRTRGVLLVFGDHAEQVCAAERRPLLDAVASLTAIAVERLHYGEVLQEVTLRMESERLRSALLSAVSHDLRTPLTVLVGMADA
jgi:two-component system sensor histidine kinase KdpD